MLSKRHKRSAQLNPEHLALIMRTIDAGMYPFQRRLVYNPSRWIVARKPRQMGYTTYSLLRILINALLNPGITWYLVSKTQRNAAKNLALLKREWIAPLALCGAPELEIVKDSVTELVLSNGSSFVAVSNNAESMRGNVGSYFLDELAFWPMRQLVALQDAVFPTLDNPFNAHLQLLAISTVWFSQGLYWEICTRPDLHPQFERLHFNIFDAVREGYPLDVEAVRARRSPASFAREYMTEFWEGSGGYYDKEQILSLEGAYCLEGELETERVLGVDLAKINDLSCVVELEGKAQLEHVHRTSIMVREDYHTQLELVSELIDACGAVACAIDITKHAGFADMLAGYRKQRAARPVAIYGINFTHKFKTQASEALYNAIQAGQITFDGDAVSWQGGRWSPWGAPQLIDDLGHVEQCVTGDNKVTYRVKRSGDEGAEIEGHGDAWSGLLLARFAWAQYSADRGAQRPPDAKTRQALSPKVEQW